MKYSKSWTQALQEVRSYNQETEVPEGLSKEGAAEFMAAASAAKKAGKKNFKFGDKEYPVTIKTDIPTEGVKEQVGVRKVDFVDGITPDLQEAKPEFEVKYASSKKGPIKVTKFMSLKDAKKFLAQVKGEGMNGIISQNGKPVKEDEDLEKVAKELEKASQTHLGQSKKVQKHLDKMNKMKEEVELDEHCGECGAEGLQEADYELYHKTFSGAMQHAYAHAKKRGFIVDPDEIDNKVATGPRKPSSGKTNKYILGTNKKQKLHVQVANLDNKRYELNMYIEGVEESAVLQMKMAADDIETYAKKHGGIDKKDMMKAASMLKKGDKKGALKFIKTLDTDPRDYLLKTMGEEVEIDEKMDGRKKFSGKQAKKDNEDRRAAQRKKLGILGPNEELVGGQKKLDKDKDGDIDAKDFAMLRKSKKKSESKLYTHVKNMMKKEYANMKKIKKG